MWVMKRYRLVQKFLNVFNQQHSYEPIFNSPNLMLKFGKAALYLGWTLTTCFSIFCIFISYPIMHFKYMIAIDLYVTAL